MTNKDYEEHQKKINKEYEDFYKLMSFYFILVMLTPGVGLGIGYLIKTFL